MCPLSNSGGSEWTEKCVHNDGASLLLTGSFPSRALRVLIPQAWPHLKEEAWEACRKRVPYLSSAHGCCQVTTHLCIPDPQRLQIHVHTCVHGVYACVRRRACPCVHVEMRHYLPLLIPSSLYCSTPHLFIHSFSVCSFIFKIWSLTEPRTHGLARLAGLKTLRMSGSLAPTIP